jgi:hypothetical protein
VWAYLSIWLCVCVCVWVCGCLCLLFWIVICGPARALVTKRSRNSTDHVYLNSTCCFYLFLFFVCVECVCVCVHLCCYSFYYFGLWASFLWMHNFEKWARTSPQGITCFICIRNQPTPNNRMQIKAQFSKTHHRSKYRNVDISFSAVAVKWIEFENLLLPNGLKGRQRC